MAGNGDSLCGPDPMADRPADPAGLERMYIHSTEGLLGTSVEYVELFGRDPRTGKSRRERIIPR